MKKRYLKMFLMLSLVICGLLSVFSFSFAAGQGQTAWETLSQEASDYLEIAINKMEEAIKTYQGANYPNKELWVEAIDYGEIETGGVLIGRISLTRRCITISRLIEAPPDSRRSPNLFVLGTKGLQRKVKEIHDKSSGFLNYVGTWHSHPKGGQPSELDKKSLEQMKKLRFGAPAVSLIWTPAGFDTIIDEGKLS